jgi:hypothetical protein
MTKSDPWKKPALGAKARVEPPAAPRTPPAVQFREEIAAALRDGLGESQMTLQLTHRAADSLKRDRTVADADIVYSDGRMLYLGVAVIAGAEVSRLERPAAGPAAEGA